MTVFFLTGLFHWEGNQHLTGFLPSFFTFPSSLSFPHLPSTSRHRATGEAVSPLKNPASPIKPPAHCIILQATSFGSYSHKKTRIKSSWVLSIPGDPEQESSWIYAVHQALKWMCREKIGKESLPLTSASFNVGVLSHSVVCSCYIQ